MRIARNLLLASLVIITCGRIVLGFSAIRASSIDSVSLMAKINQERKQRNIAELVTEPKLVAASGKKTADMFARNYFDHVNPEKQYVWPIIEAEGYKPYTMLGENLAIDFSTEDAIVKAWIASPTHRDNMLRAQFADQGLTSSYGMFEDRYTNIVTSLFGTLASPPAPAVPPSPAPAPAQPDPLPAHVPAPAPAPVTPPAPHPASPPKPELPPVEPSTEVKPISTISLDESRNDSAALVQSTSTAVALPGALIDAGAQEQRFYDMLKVVFLLLVLLFAGITAAEGLMRGGRDGIPGSASKTLLVLLIFLCSLIGFATY